MRWSPPISRHPPEVAPSFSGPSIPPSFAPLVRAFKDGGILDHIEVFSSGVAGFHSRLGIASELSGHVRATLEP
jgi:hypothetical protein